MYSPYQNDMHCGNVVAFISREANQALLPGRWTLFLAKAMRNPEK
jgi:hypothetical protein